MTLKCQPTASHFINGEYVEDTVGKVIECVFPATGEVVARLHSATSAIIEHYSQLKTIYVKMGPVDSPY